MGINEQQLTFGDVLDQVSFTTENNTENNEESTLNNTNNLNNSIKEEFISPDSLDQAEIKKDKNRRANWCFTIHRYKQQNEEEEQARLRVRDYMNNLITEKNIQYYSIGFELGKSGEKPHLQGYLYTGNNYKKTFTSIMKLLLPLKGEHPNLSYMYQKSSWEKCVNYTMKEGTFISNGLPPVDTKINENKKITFNSILQEVAEGTSLETINLRSIQHRIIISKHTRILQEAYRRYLESQPYYPPFVCWFKGHTSTGKTVMANLLSEYLDSPVFEITCDKGFFEGYQSQPYIYFDDFRFSFEDLSFNKLLSLTCEKPSMRVNIKGSSMPWRPRIIIFTSPNGVIDAKPPPSMTSGNYNNRINENFIQFKRRVHVELEFIFYTDDDNIPGYDRVTKTIKEKGIPLFLQYYRYHCDKHKIPIIPQLENIVPLMYTSDLYKDNVPRETDDIVRTDHM